MRSCVTKNIKHDSFLICSQHIFESIKRQKSENEMTDFDKLLKIKKLINIQKWGEF